jgi:hypothetical protein
MPSTIYCGWTANPRGPAYGRNLALGSSDGIGLPIGRVADAIRATRATPSIRVTDGAGVDIDSATGAAITASSTGAATSATQTTGSFTIESFTNALPPGDAVTGSTGNPLLVSRKRPLRRLTRSTKAMRRGPPTTATIVVICTPFSLPLLFED